MNRAASYLLLLTVLVQPWMNALASCCPILPQAAVAQERAAETTALTPSCHAGSEHDRVEQTDPDLTTSNSCGDHSACASCQAGACGHASTAIARSTKTLHIGEPAHFALFGGALSPAAGFDRSLLRPPSIS